MTETVSFGLFPLTAYRIDVSGGLDVRDKNVHFVPGSKERKGPRIATLASDLAAFSYRYFKTQASFGEIRRN